MSQNVLTQLQEYMKVYHVHFTSQSQPNLEQLIKLDISLPLNEAKQFCQNVVADTGKSTNTPIEGKDRHL